MEEGLSIGLDGLKELSPKREGSTYYPEVVKRVAEICGSGMGGGELVDRLPGELQEARRQRRDAFESKMELLVRLGTPVDGEVVPVTLENVEGYVEANLKEQKARESIAGLEYRMWILMQVATGVFTSDVSDIGSRMLKVQRLVDEKKLPLSVMLSFVQGGSEKDHRLLISLDPRRLGLAEEKYYREIGHCQEMVSSAERMVRAVEMIKAGKKGVVDVVVGLSDLKTSVLAMKYECGRKPEVHKGSDELHRSIGNSYSYFVGAGSLQRERKAV